MERTVGNKVSYHSIGENKQEITINASVWHRFHYFLKYKVQFGRATTTLPIYIHILNIVASQALTEEEKFILRKRLEKFIITITYRFAKTKMWGMIEDILLFSMFDEDIVQKLHYEINGKKVEVAIGLQFYSSLGCPAFERWYFHEHILTYFTILVEAENKNKFCQFLKWWLRKNSTYTESFYEL